MSKSIKEQLSNVFINGRGEVCINLETTKSKVGEEVRKTRKKVDSNKEHRQEVAQIKKKLRDLRTKEREMEQQIKALWSKGLGYGPGSEACAKCFAEANDVNNELRGVRKGIRKLNKKVHK
jgi:predicted phage-related endonuclease